LPPWPIARLFWAIVLTQAVAILMCATGRLVEPMSRRLSRVVWAYNLGWMA
jgi:H+-transporting ATPase